MGRPKKQRPTATKIFLGADGAWHGYVTVGIKPDGSPDVRHRQAKTQEECTEKIRKLEDQRSAGRVAKPGQIPTVAQLLTMWLGDAVSGDLRYATEHRSYGWALNKHLIPGLGYHRLDALIDDPKPVTDYFRGLAKTNSARGKPFAQTSVHAIWRTLRAALNWAVAQGIIRVSPLTRVKAPDVDEEEVTPLFVDEVKRIFKVCEGRPNGTRWTVGLALGFRQGEALGLPWWRPPTSTREKPVGMDPVGGFVAVRTKAERRKWEHGCGDLARCARWAHGCAPRRSCGRAGWECPQKTVRCRTSPCRPPWSHGCAEPARCRIQAWRCPRRVEGKCRTHQRATCPPLCPPACTGHARTCPQRKGGGIILGEDTKSTAGRRRIGMAPQMCSRVASHRLEQDRARELAGDLWEEHGLVWCGPTGRPIDTSADRREWKAILKLAGVRDARIHDGRHTAATLLLLMGVDPRVVVDQMGWVDSRMLKRYQHVLDELRLQAAQKVADHLWGPVEPARLTPVVTPAAGERDQSSQVSGVEFVEDSSTDLATGNVIAFRPRAAIKPPTAGGRLDVARARRDSNPQPSDP